MTGEKEMEKVERVERCGEVEGGGMGLGSGRRYVRNILRG